MTPLETDALAGDVSFGVTAIRIRADGANIRIRFEASVEAAVRAIAIAAELRDPYTPVGSPTTSSPYSSNTRKPATTSPPGSTSHGRWPR